ncbi:MAG: D-alanyl-D-alanine carboxypeptidase family protein [Syntrophobacteraceae bacterium]
MWNKAKRLPHVLLVMVAVTIPLLWALDVWAAEPPAWKKPGARAPKPAAEKAAHPKQPAGAAAKPGKQESRGAKGAAASSASGDLSPGQVDSRAAILVDVVSGVTLFEQSPDEPIEPASFTKILSLYLIFEAIQQGKIHLNDEVLISETAWRTGGSKMFVGVGTRVPLEELIKGIAVVSGNDACVAAAEHVFGSLSTFVDAMNRKAQELGMTKSRFINPHGLPAEGQVTTARDMATLDAAYINRFPDVLKYHSMHDYTYNNITQYNRNHLLLRDSTVDGLKTGFVDGARYHLSATAKRDGMRLLAVVMGAASPGVREREALKLLNYGYRNYTKVQPIADGQPAKTLKVWKGVKDTLDVYPAEPTSFTISQAQKQSLRWEVHAQEEVTAPVQAGQVLGDMVFYVGDQPRRTIKLVSREDIELAGWFKRAWQSLFHMGGVDWRWVLGVSGGIVLLAGFGLFLASRRSGFRGSMGM